MIPMQENKINNFYINTYLYDNVKTKTQMKDLYSKFLNSFNQIFDDNLDQKGTGEKLNETK